MKEVLIGLKAVCFGVTVAVVLIMLGVPSGIPPVVAGVVSGVSSHLMRRSADHAE